MRKQLFGLIVGIGMILISCTDDSVVTDPVVDIDEQKIADLKIIANFIDSLGYMHVDTTTNGVRYVILDSGSGKKIEPNDIVSFYASGRLTNNYLFATNVDTIAINDGTYDSTAVYHALNFTYTTDGWNIPELFPAYRTYESGYREGLTAVMGLMKEGGHARFMVPSVLAYRDSPPISAIPEYSVLIFDVWPTYVR